MDDMAVDEFLDLVVSIREDMKKLIKRVRRLEQEGDFGDFDDDVDALDGD